ncbi:MAG TPA: R3H domain-containing nucleic acid-binding protein [Edaphobacter sp.]|nr:R3H domain-containing nucleic acid-binding protein [Edaphobacter sp.]
MRYRWKQCHHRETIILDTTTAMTSINSQGPAAKKIEEFLQTLLTSSGLRLRFQITAGNGEMQTEVSSETQAATRPAISSQPEVSVEFTGPDTALLVARNGELLHAIEHLAAKVLRLEPEEHDRISFDAENFKLLRQRELQMIAEAAIERVRHTHRPFAFPPMNSRERRLLHLALRDSGLKTASSGLGPRRFVVLYPEGEEPIEQPQQPSTHERSRAIRSAFRRR